MSAPRVVRARPRPKSRGRTGPAARARGLAPAAPEWARADRAQADSVALGSHGARRGGDCVAPGSHYASRTDTIPDESLGVVAPRGSWPVVRGPQEGAPGRLFSGVMAAPSCLDHLCSVGPLACGWTTCVRLDHLVHEIRWSNGTQVVQPHASGPSRPAASRHARRRPTMRDAPSGRSGSGGTGTAPAPPGPPPTTGPPIPSRPTPPGTPGGDPGGPSRPAPRPSALDNPSYHTRGTRSEPHSPNSLHNTASRKCDRTPAE